MAKNSIHQTEERMPPTGWFLPYPEEFPSQRAQLMLGLNGANRFYRELIVPGIGGVRFVRQLSWAVAGIELAEGSKYKASKIANGIEALACKIKWYSCENEDEYRDRGIRAFTRDENSQIWTFEELTKQKNYVQITYRMASTRALWGLGLTTQTRFNSMELTKSGKMLSACSTPKLKNSLLQWINGDDEIIKKLFFKKFKKAILKDYASLEEKEVVRNVLYGSTNDGFGDGNRRVKMLKALEKQLKKAEPDIEKLKNDLKDSNEIADNINKSLAFDAMLKAAQTLLYTIAEKIADQEKIDPADKDLGKSIKTVIATAECYLSTKGQNHSDASAFANTILVKRNGADIINEVVKRDGKILLFLNDRIIKGNLFERRKDPKIETEETESEGEEATSTVFKIRQLFDLLKETSTHGQ